MKCLIIAAGKGERLANIGCPKPLIKLIGKPLITRIILTAHKLGINDFYVVTNSEGKKIRTYLDSFSQDKTLRITHLINREKGKENGVSVLKAKKYLSSEDFLLLMSDHIFDKNILEILLQSERDSNQVFLAVDYKINNNTMVDLDDVTRVMVDDQEKIINIGKDIKEYNAFDTGIFLCSPLIFEALEESISNGDTTLSGGLKVLAQKGKVKAVNIEDACWIDVDNELALKKAENYLCQNIKKISDGPVAYYLNRPISLLLTRWLVRKRIIPNQVSVFSFILSLLGSLFFLLGGYLNLVIGGILAQISSIVDGCDGEIARLTFQESAFGGWFDAVLDRYADAFLLFGLTYHILGLSWKPSYLWVGFLALIGTYMNSYTADKYDRLMKRKLLIESKKRYFRLGRDVRIFLVFIGALFNQIFLILVVLAIITNLENIRRIILCYKQR
ncbi:MAG: bifunctional L-myo-inositol-1-phosphate cytidylyltransferase/CDP-L-myo-inositol myo-inositolphosphotransferase [Candidatus Caldatribacteriota bacterium]